ncbi:MAG: xanthine dehydrogenase family protein molybdopterin-binding subunit [Acidimicrobiales bacterium]|jgi:carbon-monoxide dehydrogenase large subunit|nr:xanthine dehydrogenase family protein molybdopterin-binding subunit [Acidimicrobiales bacterium]MDP6299007.1 xanthine dehydrogenase family protein molybdopterin-binding subunit [Acidimicrobiales bacterium]HJM27509.1 xanthine dehydrogenase family protein molybdopterin-binding subunit [Acidimicrobiales bacterium]
MTAVKGSILGNAVLRREDPTLLTGEDKYFDDMEIEGLGFVYFARSPVAHANIISIDTSDAETISGVVGVWTADDLELEPFLGFPMFPPLFARPPLAKGKVRLVGDIIAVVVADSFSAAADAAAAVWMDFESLPAVTDPEKALQDEAPILFEENGSNQCFETGIGLEDGDPNEGADYIAKVRIVSQRLAGVPLESNGIIAIPEGDGSLTAWIPSQNPISVREALAAQLSMEQTDLRVVAPTVGGGFGPKSGVYVEHVITAELARLLKRPLKWTELRSENMLSLAHGRGMIMYGEMGFSSDGQIIGLDASVIADAGAYPAIGGFLTFFTQTMIQGVYDIPRIRYHARSAATNTTQTAAYRGAGRPEATQLLERLIDIASDELGMDPAELRHKNFLSEDAFPLTTLGGANYDSGDYALVLNRVLEEAGYDSLLADQEKRRLEGGSRQLGIGLSTYVEVTAPAGLHMEYGAVEVNDDGSVTARVGTSAHGQGHITAFSMIISEMLGVDMENITILQSDTDEIPRGQGTMGSRSLQTAGSAIHVASETVLEKAKELASHLLEASADDIVAGEGGLHVAGVPSNSLSWADLAQASNDDDKRPDGMDSGLAHELDFDGTDSTFPFGAHVAVVEVDTETGGVELLRHIAVDDCGRILNPMLVTGQQHGGIAQGVAQALFESVSYDEEGNPVTGNLMDYAMPSAAELPSFETHNTETPSPRNPLGAKGIGESGTIGSTPAIQNAVVDAVAHLGVRHIDMPLTSMSVWNAIKESQKS